MTLIYGVDTTQSYTNQNVRDAIIECFAQAHKEILEKELKDFSKSMTQESFERLKEMNADKLVHSILNQMGADFENPKKEDLVAVCDRLSEIAKEYRGSKIIKKHYDEIMELVEGLK